MSDNHCDCNCHDQTIVCNLCWCSTNFKNPFCNCKCHKKYTVKYESKSRPNSDSTNSKDWNEWYRYINDYWNGYWY